MSASRRLALVGVGAQGGNWWTDTLHDNPTWETVAFVEVNAAAVEAHRAESGLPADRYFDSLAAAVAATRPEACVLAVPSPAHPELIERALGLDLHVVVEKPFALDFAAAERLTQVAEDAGRQLVVCQQYRSAPVFRALAREIADGRVGTPELASVSSLVTLWLHQVYDSYLLRVPHMHLYEMSVHLFDLMRFVFGTNATRVYAHSVNPSWSWYERGGGACSAIIEFDGGPTVAYSGSFVSQGRSNGFYGDWRVEGADGCLEVHADGPEEASVLSYTAPPPRDNAERLLWAPPREPVALPPDDRGGLGAVLDQLAVAIDGGPPPATHAADNLHTLAICDACRRSVELGEPVDVWNGSRV